MSDCDSGAVPSISAAVVLMAGAGSRLRVNGFSVAKPLVTIRGRPLISYTLEYLLDAGIKTIHAVVGFEGDSLISQLRPFIPPMVDFRFIVNRQWRKQNGISLLTAASRIRSSFVVAMSDHLFDRSIIHLLLRNGARHELNVAIDRKLGSIFDREDAMKIRMCGDRVCAISKHLRKYDAIDTGLFLCPVEIFRYLERAKCNGDCALADGVRLMAADGKVRGIDIGAAWWQDIDTPEMFEHAEKKMRKHLRTQGSVERNAF